VTITHIFFNLPGTLADNARLRSRYAEHLGRVMAERFGGDPAAWMRARFHILSDWDSYFADLNFDGDDGLNDLWEGELRVTRALFRLTGIAEPDSRTLAALSRELPYQVSRHCDVLYSDSQPVIRALHQAGFIPGVATHSISSQVRGILEGAGVVDYFCGPFLCPDLIERFRRDRAFFLAADIPPEKCLVVDSQIDGIEGAHAAGMRTVYVCRNGQLLASPADCVLTGDLYGLLAYLGI
jgi:beta-phosphoglucomutase-like phosphatase (HAD superfamily)